ncbi:MAG: hypothetical protein AAFR46_09415, partial [Pseudomonadota bacterium]
TAEIVVIDLPALSANADPPPLSRLVDDTIVTAAWDRTRADRLRRVLDQTPLLSDRIRGLVLLGARRAARTARPQKWRERRYG